MKKVPKCPECELINIDEKIDWETEPDDGELILEMDDSGVHAVGNCPRCGHEFHEQYLVSGIFDPSNQEYIVEYP